MAELHALIFDVDGTLANTERDGHRVAFNRAFAEAGLDWHWSVSLYGEVLAVAGGKERIRFYLNHYRSDFPPTANLDRLSADLHAAIPQALPRIVGFRSHSITPWGGAITQRS